MNMLIIGERINASRKKIEEAVGSKDAKFIQQEAKAQVERGARMLEINCGTRINTEPEDMAWLVETIQGAVDIPLSIDSPNPAAIEAGLKIHKGKALVNSITAEERRASRILPLVKKYNSSLVALLMDEKGVSKTVEERLAIAKKLLAMVVRQGIREEDVYLDPLVRPISTEPEQATRVLEAIKVIKGWNRAKTLVGLSNISFGLPNRSLINRTFLAMALEVGVDAAMIDPLDPAMIATLRASEAILGKDENCLGYISAYRKGQIKGY